MESNDEIPPSQYAITVPISATQEVNLAHWHLNSIEISGGFLTDFRLDLPSGLICIIGPRGSGKSTLAEALRLGIGGVPANATKDRHAFIKANLGSSLITIKTSSVGERGSYTIRRSYGQPATLTGVDGHPVSGVDLDRGSFLPLDAYSSLEIEAIAQESVGDKRRALLDELSPSEMQRIQLSLADQRRTLEANADAIGATQRRIADLREQIEELGDVAARMASLPPVTDQTASPEFKIASAQRDANEVEATAVRSVLEQLGVLKTSLKTTVENTKRRFPTLGGITESQNKPTMDSIATVAGVMWTAVESGLESIVLALAKAEKEIGTSKAQLATAHATQDAAYRQLQQLNQDAVKALEAHSTLTREAATVERLQKERTESEAELKKLQEARSAIKAEFLLTRDQISELREGVATRLQKEAGRKVQIRLQRNADALDYQQQLLAAIQGSKTKNQDETVRALSQIPPEQLAQLIRDNDLDELDTQCLFGRERGRKILDSLRDKLNPLTLEILPIDDRVRIELNVANDEPANFKDAAELSRGQKCTALLPILLARRDSPLVIDQPEDNLDNHFIYETVVESILRLKSRRQMIFITHNANIPVLGEAELVVVMNSDGERGFVEKAGTVDECRKEIIDLLEGGEEAFQLRRRRYGN